MDKPTDTEILDFILDNSTIAGGGDGATLTVSVPVDHEDFKCAVIECIKRKLKPGRYYWQSPYKEKNQ